MSETRRIAVTVNGRRYEETVETRYTLADFLRQQLGLTGTHLGCEHGVCGACTVLVDGRSARSCLMLAVQANGREITTVEGIAPDQTNLHPKRLLTGSRSTNLRRISDQFHLRLRSTSLLNRKRLTRMLFLLRRRKIRKRAQQ